MDATSRSLCEDRPSILDHKGSVALESRVAIWQHPHEPGAGSPVDLEGRRGGGFHARAERARDSFEGVERGLARHEEGLPLGAAGSNGHPPSRKRVNAKLVHVRIRTSFETESRQIIVISFKAIATKGGASRLST